MKLFILIVFSILSLSAFSQSYTILNNGVVLTLDSAGFVYDFSQFTLPYKVSAAGGRFYVDDEKLVTVTKDGFLFRTDMKVKKIKGKGYNYFVSAESSLITINSQGLTTKLDKEKSLSKKLLFGGNYIIAENEIITIGENGLYTKFPLKDFKVKSVAILGGNYFVSSDGVMFTVSKDGFVFDKASVGAGTPKVLGGNYFVDDKAKLYTVSNEGFLMLPLLPGELKIADIKKAAWTYLINLEGQIFTVNQKGEIFFRTVENHDLKEAKILAL